MSAARKPQARGIFEQPSSAARDLTIGANQIATNHPDLNPYELRNDLLLEEERARVYAESRQPMYARRPQ